MDVDDLQSLLIDVNFLSLPFLKGDMLLENRKTEHNSDRVKC